MIEAPEINSRVEKFQEQFHGYQNAIEIREIMTKMLKPWNVKITIRRSDDVPIQEISIGGSFDHEKRYKQIELDIYLNPKQKKFGWNEYNLPGTMFLLRQVLQHELIHQYQMQQRHEESRGMVSFYAVVSRDPAKQEECDYLSELDEIDAYAHDIAMEILHYYPDEDPYQVLKAIRRKRYLTSWKIYSKAFKHCKDWSQVRQRLLTKVYNWIPYVTA